jgi:hypothetical protein
MSDWLDFAQAKTNNPHQKLLSPCRSQERPTCRYKPGKFGRAFQRLFGGSQIMLVAAG